MRDLLLRWFKEAHLQKPWPNMSEGDQRTWINRIEERAEKLVDEVVEIVNHGDFPVVNAKIDSFTVKNGEVKVVTKGFADNDMLAILNSAGEKRVQITVMRNDQFDQERDTLHPEPDQPGLPGVKMSDEPGFEDDAQDPAPEPEIQNPAGEAEAGEEILKPKSDQWRGGFNSRMAGHKREENPFLPGEKPMQEDWFAGWDHADFDDKAPKLTSSSIGEVSGESQKQVAAPKPKKAAKPKAGPVVEPDIEGEAAAPAAAGELQTEGDPASNAAAAITDQDDVAIESADHAQQYGAWCRSDGRGTGSNPFPPMSDFGKAWLRGYSEQRRKDAENPPVDDGF